MKNFSASLKHAIFISHVFEPIGFAVWKMLSVRNMSQLHTLGNLTLTGYNSEYSDRPFTEKRDMEGGFKHSPLKLNQGLGSLERWDENAINHRAQRISRLAVDIWEYPQLDSETLSAYKKGASSKSDYSIDDHPHLVSGKMRPLFEAFRREVLALDPNISEDYLKLYVAYKAETNFVDVVRGKVDGAMVMSK